MDEKQLKALSVELMDAVCSRKLAEFSLDTENFSISIKTQAPVVQMATASAPALATVAASAPEAEMATAEDLPVGTRVEAPLVGVFYAGATPEEPPFVEIGQKVQKGDTLCIIEAMKTMNEIAAPCDGTVNRIFAQNGEMVEYKQLLCIIE